MPTWPASLPQQPLIDGYQESTPNTLVRTQMDKGPDKVRRRFTAGTRTFAVQFLLDETQTATLETFIEDDLEGGALQFDHTHPRTGASVSFRIVPVSQDALVTYANTGGVFYRVQMQLEILPS
jgi:hypothetical protein